MITEHSNILQAYQLETLVKGLHGSGYRLSAYKFELEDETRFRLARLSETVYVTSDPLGMHAFISALIALEEK